MIWGYDYSARLIVNVILLVVILSVVLLRRYVPKKRSNNGENKSRYSTSELE